ncbi:nucleotidyltransferase family protein [Dyadobacter sp. CY347]|uniref:nucleotidyltransferase family protein n=1 Tax=Dyadobacter sp. CY347 TaxID=2909336 RepID=UPI001F4572FC|nr:nucleotidyltransferase domain-containing protein [Dyadobacter sp. CY347]MCF2491238.1 nucleotidyltransferase domain-containing protein [Dyadobacter sp. CY347]
MTEEEKFQDLEQKIRLGMKKTFESVLEFKRQKNSPLVVMRGDKIVKIMPEDFHTLKRNDNEMNMLERYKQAIIKLCKAHKVKSLYAFGSVLTDHFDKDSDIDLIVDFTPMEVEDYADNYFDFKFSLQDIFQRQVDLLEEKAIKNPYFLQNVNQKKQLVYGH